MSFEKIMWKIIGVIYGILVSAVMALFIPVILYLSFGLIIIPIVIFIVTFIPFSIHLIKFGMGIYE